MRSLLRAVSGIGWAGLVVSCGLVACTGEDPVAGNPVPPTGDSGPPPVGSSQPDTGAPIPDGGAPDVAKGTVAGAVIDHLGLPLAQAKVTLTDAAGKVREVTTGPDGKFSAGEVDAPYDAIVQRQGSLVRHVFLGVSLATPTFRTYGENAVTEVTRSMSLTLTPAPAPAADTVRIVGRSDAASVGKFDLAAGRFAFYALADTKTFSTTLSAVVIPSAGARPTAFGETTVTADSAAATSFTGSMALTAVPATGGAAVATTLVRPPGLKVPHRALKLDFGPRAIAIAQTNTNDDTRGNFGDFTTLGVAGRKYAVESLAAADVFAISGRGRVVTAPISFSRRANLAENGLNVALELAPPATVSTPAEGATGVARKGPVVFAAAAPTTFQRVHAVRVVPKAQGGGGASFIVYGSSSATSFTLPGDGLAASTVYTAQVFSIGPYANLDAFLSSTSPLPLEVLDIAGVFAEAGLLRPSQDGGDAFVAISGGREFTTGL